MFKENMFIVKCITPNLWAPLCSIYVNIYPSLCPGNLTSLLLQIYFCLYSFILIPLTNVQMEGLTTWNLGDMFDYICILLCCTYLWVCHYKYTCKHLHLYTSSICSHERALNQLTATYVTNQMELLRVLIAIHTELQAFYKRLNCQAKIGTLFWDWEVEGRWGEKLSLASLYFYLLHAYKPQFFHSPSGRISEMGKKSSINGIQK